MAKNELYAQNDSVPNSLSNTVSDTINHEAADTLSKEGIQASVYNMHTIKPLDDAAILASVAKTKCVVTAEEHNILGGLGESVARVLAINNPVPQEFVAVNDTFGESGTPAQLMEKYKLNDKAIVAAVKKVITRK